MQTTNHRITEEDISNTEKLLKKGFTHAEIASLIGISKTSVSRISTGTHCLQKARTVKEQRTTNKVSRSETSVPKAKAENVDKPAIDNVKTTKQTEVNSCNGANSTTVTVVHTVDAALMNVLMQFTAKLTDAVKAVNVLNNTLAGKTDSGTSKACRCKKSQVGDTDFDDMLDDSKYVDLFGDEVCQ